MTNFEANITSHGSSFQFQLPSKKAGILTASMYKREQEKLKGMAKEMNEMAIAIIGKTLLARIDKLKEQCENDKINAGTLNSLERFLGKWDDIWKDNVDSSKLKNGHAVFEDSNEKKPLPMA
jgi:hypothetical protein